MIELGVRCQTIFRSRCGKPFFNFFMNTKESATESQSLNTYTEQPVSAPPAEEKDLTINFFVVGGIINITMILAYFVWAFGAWKKADKRKGR